MIGMVTNTLLLVSHDAHEDYFLLIKENLFWYKDKVEKDMSKEKMDVEGKNFGE